MLQFMEWRIVGAGVGARHFILERRHSGPGDSHHDPRSSSHWVSSLHSLPLPYSTWLCWPHRLCRKTKTPCLPLQLLFFFFLLDRFPVIKRKALRGSRLAQERSGANSHRFVISRASCHSLYLRISSDGCPAPQKSSLAPSPGSWCSRGGGGGVTGRWGHGSHDSPWLAVHGPCVFSYLPHRAWKEQLPASGRPEGSQLGALAALGEEDPGTRRKAVAWYWGVVDAWHLAVPLGTKSPKYRSLFPSHGWPQSHSPPTYSPPSSLIYMWTQACHHPSCPEDEAQSPQLPSTHSTLWC